MAQLQLMNGGRRPESHPAQWGRAPWKISYRSPLRRIPQQVDFAIVGGGFTGLAAAALLKRAAPRKSVLLLEAKRIGNGASSRTGGMVLAETAAGDLPGLGDVLKGYRKILRELKVDADLALPGVWEIARGNRSMEGKPIRAVKTSPINWSDSGSVRVVRKVPGGTVDPGKVVDGLARAAVRVGALIAENTEITKIHFNAAIRLRVTWKQNGKRSYKWISADRVFFATNAGSLSLTDGFFWKFGKKNCPVPKLTFALATAPLSKKQLAALGLSSGRPFYTVDLPYLWGRLFKNRRLIFGSGLVPGFDESLSKRGKKRLWSGLEQENVLRGASRSRLKMLEQRVRVLHPTLRKIRVTHRWCGPILITKDFVPVFQTHPKNTHLLFLGGYSGHGVAQSVYLAHRAAQILLGKSGTPKWS